MHPNDQTPRGLFNKPVDDWNRCAYCGLISVQEQRRADFLRGGELCPHCGKPWKSKAALVKEQKAGKHG